LPAKRSNGKRPARKPAAKVDRAQAKARGLPATREERRPTTAELMKLLKPGGNRKPGTKVTEKVREDFLTYLAATGMHAHAAVYAGVVPKTIIEHRHADPEFDDRVLAAESWYRETIQSEVRRRATGYKKPLSYQGKLTGDTVEEYDSKMLELEARRVEPGYRDKAAVDVNVAPGGVVAVGQQAQSTEEFLERYREVAEDAEFEVTEGQKNGG